MLHELVQLQLQPANTQDNLLLYLLNFSRYGGYILQADRQICNLVMWIYFRILCTKNY